MGKVVLRCKVCGKTSSDVWEMADHFIAEHPDISFLDFTEHIEIELKEKVM